MCNGRPDLAVIGADDSACVVFVELGVDALVCYLRAGGGARAWFMLTTVGC
jgi:hypothetical protein